jgi:hypothetical protein
VVSSVLGTSQSLVGSAHQTLVGFGSSAVEPIASVAGENYSDIP